MKIHMRWGRVAGMVVLGVVIAAMLIWALAGGGLPTSEVNEDHGSAPRCTDAIADAGGTCWGEPLPACVTEDSTNCYWDARAMGNGEGMSFVDVDGSRTFGNQ